MQQPVVSRALGGAYAVIASLLLAAQAPLSSPAAQHFSLVQILFLTQMGLLASVPPLLVSEDARLDFRAALGSLTNYGKLAVMLCYQHGGTRPLHRQLTTCSSSRGRRNSQSRPFWGALVACLLTRTPIPVSPLVFTACVVLAFVGATAVAWSQAKDGAGLAAQLVKGTWLFALPIPIFTVLSASLIAKWFSNLNESGAFAANILIGCIILIPVTAVLLIARGEPILPDFKLTLLMIAGIILADAIGRVFYQKALTATGDDNGFVTMFQNLEPGIAALISFCLSPWIQGLRFEAGWIFFAGLGLTAAILFVFSLRSLQQRAQREKIPPLSPRRCLAVRL